MKLTLEAARVNAGLSRVETAQKTGLSVETLRQWEVGNVIPKPIHLMGLAKIYGVEEDIFLLPESKIN